jgi:hypothetical protein
MGTNKPRRDEKLTEPLAIQTTVMAIREEIMQYFKGSCIEKLTENTNVRLVFKDQRSNYFYERRDAENRQPALIFIGGVPVLGVQHAPDKITFYTGTLKRSKQLAQVMVELEKFTKDYLGAIERSYHANTVTYS